MRSELDTTLHWAQSTPAYYVLQVHDPREH
jgi:hypothetical protein